MCVCWGGECRILARPQAQSGWVWCLQWHRRSGPGREPCPSQGWSRNAYTIWRLDGARAGLSAGLEPPGLGSRSWKREAGGSVEACIELDPTESHWCHSVLLVFQEFTLLTVFSHTWNPTSLALPCGLPFAPNTTKSTTDTNPRRWPSFWYVPSWTVVGHTPANCPHTELLITFLLPPSFLPTAFVDLGLPQQLTLAAQLCWLVLGVQLTWQSGGARRPPWVAFWPQVTGLASCMVGYTLQTRSAQNDLGVFSRCLNWCMWQKLVNC